MNPLEKALQAPQAITHLDLNQVPLGVLPPEIGTLTELETLILWNNGLHQLPPELGALKKLRSLVINANPLRKLPPELGQLESLEELIIGSCESLETLPAELSQLTNLRSLSLSFLTSLRAIPAEVVAMASLDKESKKDLKKYEKAFAKLREKAAKPIHKRLPFAHECQVTLTLDDTPQNAVLLNWSLVSPGIKEELLDELGDELAEHKGFRPFALLTEASGTLGALLDDPIEDYLLWKPSTGQILRSGHGKLDQKVEDLHITAR